MDKDFTIEIKCDNASIRRAALNIINVCSMPIGTRIHVAGIGEIYTKIAQHQWRHNVDKSALSDTWMDNFMRYLHIPGYGDITITQPN